MTTRADSSETSEAPAPDTSLVGKKVQKYEIVRVIGRGGMGTVYEALNTAIGKRVAMKFVDADMTANKDAVARFQREAQAASAVESAHIVEIFDSGTSDDGLPFIVMELLRGEDLGHRIKRNGRLELAEAAHITAQILRGLHRAHEAGIIHRDLKPDNVFLVDRDDDPNFAKILDFGISKVRRRSDVPVSTLTRQGTVLGTPFYMSPEQAQALSDIDGRTDLWSVGAILYECLCGRPPYGGATYEQVIINICMKDAEDARLHNPLVPEGIAQVLAKALSRDRDARFGAAREFLDALINASGGLISSRRGVTDEASHTSTPAPALTRTPSASGSNVEPSGFAPTLEAHPAGTSKVGWATSGRRHGALENPRFWLVGAVALLSGVIVGLLFLREPRREVAPSATTTAAATSARPAEVSLELRANAPHARFTIDGVDAPNGVVRGKPGEVRRVRVEAEGVPAFETEVSLVEDGPKSMTINVPVVASAVTRSPDVLPAGEASAAPSAESTKPAARKAHSNPARPSKAEAAQAPPPSPPPASTGLAGGLQLHKD